jgi:hypothetical protein
MTTAAAWPRCGENPTPRCARITLTGSTPFRPGCLHATELRCGIGVLALVGTSKGLFLLRGDDDRQRWLVDGPLLEGWGV